METKKDFLLPVSPDKSFKLKSDHDQVLAEIHSLEGLLSALEAAPAEALVFHTAGRNDFATWIRDAVRYTSLSHVVDNIRAESGDVEDIRKRLVTVLELAIDLARESQKIGLEPQ